MLRILRLLRGVRSGKTLAAYLLVQRAESAFLAVAFIAILLLVFSSIAICEFEQGEGVNITGPEDALWWSFVTMTTWDMAIDGRSTPFRKPRLRTTGECGG